MHAEIKEIRRDSDTVLQVRVVAPVGDRVSKGWIVLLHGLLGAARNLWRVAQSLSEEGYGVLLYDQRGHGHSSWLADPHEYDLDLFASDLEFILDSLGLANVQLCGHSMGGRVCLRAVQLMPKRVLSVALLDVGPWLSDAAHNDLCEILDPLPLRFSSKEEALAIFAPQGAGMQQFLFANLKRGEGLTYEWACDFEKLRRLLHAGIGVDQSASLRDVQCPVLLLRGALSEHFTAQEAMRAQALNPNRIKIREVSGARHWLHADNFEGTWAALREWYGENENHI